MGSEYRLLVNTNASQVLVMCHFLKCISNITQHAQSEWCVHYDKCVMHYKKSCCSTKTATKNPQNGTLNPKQEPTFFLPH